MRQGTRRWPPKYDTLKAAYIGRKKNKKTGRLAMHYRCNACSKEFPGKEVQVDHIIPVVSLEGFTTWDEYINRLFCDASNLQVLCLKCHEAKTHKEKQHRSKKDNQD